MFGFIVHLLVSALAFWVVAQIVPGWKIKNFATACVVALVYGVLLRLVFIFHIFAIIASLPFVILLPASVVFGLISFVISLGVVIATDKLVDDFQIESLSTAVIGSLVLSVVQTILHRLI